MGVPRYRIGEDIFVLRGSPKDSAFMSRSNGLANAAAGTASHLGATCSQHVPKHVPKMFPTCSQHVPNMFQLDNWIVFELSGHPAK